MIAGSAMKSLIQRVTTDNPVLVEKFGKSLNMIQEFRENQNKKKLPINIKRSEKFNIEAEMEHFLDQIRQKLKAQTSKSFSEAGYPRTE